MKSIQPLSEDFLYWSPEYISCYLAEAGPEDAWFIDRSSGISAASQPAAVLEVDNEN